MNNWSWLCKLYYDIGEQKTDFQCQIAWKDQEGEQFWSKRKSFLTLQLNPQEYWVNKANNRTLLKNEIVLDYDRVIPVDDVLKDEQVLAAITFCKKKNYKYAVYHTGSKGVHFHIYIKEIAFMSQKDRSDQRKRLIQRFCGGLGHIPNFSGDYNKTSDNVPIALEFAKHWKSGRPKVLLESNFL